MQRFFVLLLLVSILSLQIIASPQPVQAQTTTVFVIPGNLQGWGNDSSGFTTNPFQFVTGPGTPPGNFGSLAVSITAGGRKQRLMRFDVNTPIANFGMTYSTYLDPAATDTGTYYANVYIDQNGGTASCDHRLDFAPNASGPGTWQSWNVTTATNLLFKTNGCFGAVTYAPGTTGLAAYAASNPNAVVVGVAIQAGDSEDSYVGFTGNLDVLRINNTIYDFETQIPTATDPFIEKCSLDDGRINTDCPQPVTAFCTVNNGIDVYWIKPDQPEASKGYLIIRLTAAEIKAVGVPAERPVALKSYRGVTVYRLPSGEFQINTVRPDGKPYVFLWDACPHSYWKVLEW